MMEEYEKGLSTLTPLELMQRYEELTIALAEHSAIPGDYHRQMLCKRVLLRMIPPQHVTIKRFDPPNQLHS